MERRKDNKGRVLNKGESQRKDLTYMYRYKDLNGERKSVYARTLNDLRKKEKEINRDLEMGIYATNWTLNELFQRYMDQKIDIKPRTKNKYKTEYERWVSKTWLGKKKIADITKSDIALFYKNLSEEKKYSNGTIKCIHKYINGALEMAYQDDLIRRNFASDCAKPYSANNKRKALTKDETSRFLKFAEQQSYGRRYLFVIKLMLLTGMRVGEATGLTWDDVDLKNKILSVNHQFVLGDENSRTTYHIDTPKTFSGIRKVPMSSDLVDLLKELRETTYFDAFKFNASVDGYQGFVVHTQTGLPVLTSRVNEYLKRIVTEYNEKFPETPLPHITCHTCRHTFCTRMAELNMNINALQKIVGHSSFRTTADVYISVEDKFVNEEFFKVMRGAS